MVQFPTAIAVKEQALVCKACSEIDVVQTGYDGRPGVGFVPENPQDIELVLRVR